MGAARLALAFLNCDIKEYWGGGFVQAFFTDLNSALKMRIKLGDEKEVASGRTFFLRIYVQK